MHFNTAQVKFIPEVSDYKGVAAEGKTLEAGGAGRTTGVWRRRTANISP